MGTTRTTSPASMLRNAARFALSALLAGSTCAAIAGAQTRPALPETFTATAVNMSGIGSAVPTPLDITITRWTSVAEQERYISILRDKGGDVLAEALRKGPSIGSIRTPASLAYDFRYAIEERTRNNERRIILLADRPIEFAEMIDRSHSLDYPFSAIELLLDDSGRGKGNLWIAAKLTLLDNLLIVDNYADRPVTLNDVRRTSVRR
jgi:hypothetical protein